jgi:hypothetical protein
VKGLAIITAIMFLLQIAQHHTDRVPLCKRALLKLILSQVCVVRFEITVS